MSGSEELCRLCANLINNQYAQSLFEQEQQELLRQVQELTGLQLKRGKHLPHHICLACQAQTMQAHEFRQCCIQAQQQFTTEKFSNQIKEEAASNYCTQVEILNDDADECDFQDYNEDDEDYQPNTDVDKDDESIESSDEDKHSRNVNNLQADSSKKTEVENLNPTLSVSRLFPCQMCESRFVNKLGLARHIRRKHSKEPKAKQKLICELCGKDFNTGSKLTLHMMRHGGKKSHPCELCPKGYYTRTELTHHMYTHTGELPFPCKYCDRRFNSRSHLLRHTRTHTNERPFVCNYCGKAFTSSNIHKSHLLTHTGVRAFDCELCNVSFKRKTNLDSHYRSKSHKRKEEENQQISQCDS